MEPNYKRSATAALETVIDFDLDTNRINPLSVLSRLKNVLLLPYKSEHESGTALFIAGDNQDAFTLVNRKNGKLQYIVIYNLATPQTQLDFALSRELGHIILEHDGTSPEAVWDAEANCFAHHFLCPVPMAKEIRINFRPQHSSLLWELKNIHVFNSIENLKLFVAEEGNKFKRFIGKSESYGSTDVELINKYDFDHVTGWKNCFNVVLDGRTVGVCGE